MSFLSFACIVLGSLLMVAGLVGMLSGERLREHLTNSPFHRDGDALVAYLSGLGRCFLIAGCLLVTSTVLWLWVSHS